MTDSQPVNLIFAAESILTPPYNANTQLIYGYISARITKTYAYYECTVINKIFQH
jgi:hypothetical protein